MIATALTLAIAPGRALAQRALGVDVSNYQGPSINWSSVKGAGITFAWAKATEGTYYIDPDFTINESHAKSAGVVIGAYHFARPDLTSPSSEAGYFWNEAKSYIQADGKTLMPMLDMETWNGVVGASSYSAWANAWCNAAVSDAAGQGVSIRPFIYTSACSACNFNTSVSQWFSDIANYNGENPQTGTPWSACSSCAEWGSGVWTTWQYSSSGSVSGISGGVDVDVYNGSTTELKLNLVAKTTDSHPYIPGDFDGDGKTDYVLFRPSNVNWYIRGSVTGTISSFSFGNSTDIPMIGNWTTPTGAEAALFRPSNGTFYVRLASGTVETVPFGTNGDMPLIGAWSGQMRDQAVFRPSNGTWYIRIGGGPNGGSVYTIPWGQTGDIPLVGNWGGAGMVDQTVFRPSNGTWYIRIGGGPNGGATYTVQWGQNGDIPMIGAWSGQMRDQAVFRPSEGKWYVRFGGGPNGGSTSSFVFGQNGDIPQVGNIFGNGVIDQIVFRPSTETWYVRDGKTGTVYHFAFGDSTDQPVSE